MIVGPETRQLVPVSRIEIPFSGAFVPTRPRDRFVNGETGSISLCATRRFSTSNRTDETERAPLILEDWRQIDEAGDAIAARQLALAGRLDDGWVEEGE